jgi:hypothetical protein
MMAWLTVMLKNLFFVVEYENIAIEPLQVAGSSRYT